MLKWLGGLFDSNEKELGRLRPRVERVHALEPEVEGLSDSGLRARTDEFKERLERGESLDDLLVEAFAVVREAARRNIGQRPFDAQVMGGIVLHQGKIAEMKTGEGKTLVATLPLYLNALTGRGCHLVTVNDYLAKRDPHWMGPIFHALGVSVASIQHETAFLYDPEYPSEDPRWDKLRPISRRQAYEADIAYGTNHEFGFDYLRDNMAVDLSQLVQRPLHYAIVDEVDNILIDEARTPLIISGQAQKAADRYYLFARLIPRLKAQQDYVIDEKMRTVNLTEEGTASVERMLEREGVLKSHNLFDPANVALTYFLESALKAHVLFKRDKDYVVKEGQVIIVDEFTGRLMFGRRYSEGLHQGIEAKERVKVQGESLTMATITLQNYFRIYGKLAGMTGTAMTEAEEFHKIYKLEVVAVPTHKPMIRTDNSDLVYKSEEAKFRAVVGEVERLHQEGSPALVGTSSIERNEELSELLKRRGIPHQILNAKQHEREADIISRAGEPGAVTVATNMAGRGVDIILGGNPEGQSEKDWQAKHDRVVELGGLHVLGTERHEARRIDNQLRGRSGRQGDPGGSRFFVSLEDDIMRRFGGDRVKSVMEWAGMSEDVPIESGLVGKVIENAQVKVEGFHFDIRKHLVDYDDVINRHREVIYGERSKILEGADLKANVLSMVGDEIRSLVAGHYSDDPAQDRDAEAFKEEVAKIFPLPPGFNEDDFADRTELETALIETAEALYDEKENEMGAENMRVLERLVMLRTIDDLWVEHLTQIENMRHGIGLQAVGQRDPLIAYKTQGHGMFQGLLDSIRYDVVHAIYRVGIAREPAPPPRAVAPPRKAAVAAVAGDKVGRNDPCPCGSGKKYKRCHGT